MVKMIKKLKRSIFGNDKPPVQVPVDDEEYIVVGEEHAPYEIKEDIKTSIPKTEEFEKKEGKKEEKKEKEKEESKPQIKIITKKITPKILTIRIKTPDDFDSIKEIVEHDLLVIIIDVPPEAIVKEFLDFKGYLETMNYNLGKVEENVILAYKSGITIDRYPPKMNE